MHQHLTILEVLRQRSPVSRAELAETTGLSAATVSRAVNRLLRDSLVRERLGPAPRLGRPPRLVELQPAAALIVGIDAGGSMFRAVVADLEGVVRARLTRPVSDARDRDAVLRDLVLVAGDVTALAGGRPLLAVAAGVSGIVDHASGQVLLAPDLPALDGAPIATLLQEELGVPVSIDNDDLLAAVGEAAAGAARGCADVAFLSLGYGLGAGLIVGGRPVRGASHAAGAIAYLAPGRLEDRASGRAIPSRYRDAVTRAGAAGRGGRPAAGIEQPVWPDARGVFELAAGGDPIAAAVIDEVVDALGELVVNVAALLDPEVIVLGGGLASSGAVLFEVLSGRLASAVPFPPRLVPSALEDAAVVHGAVSVALALARRHLGDPGGARRAAPPDPARLGALQLI